ncbi:MAG: cobalamin-binding protein [Archaeoglobales archaeon]|nr:cobalamin-binding protein [Archaeoglobales archaeon]
MEKRSQNLKNNTSECFNTKWSKVALILMICLPASFCVQISDQSSKKGENELMTIDLTTFNLSFDDTGYEIKKGEPKRIVSLSPSNTEILFAIGAGDRVIGVTDYCDYPPEVLEKLRKGEIQKVGGYVNFDLEKVLALKPDLVVSGYGNDLEAIETLRKYTKVIAFNPKNIKEIERTILAIGKAVGNYENAEKIVSEMEKRISEIKAKEKSGKKVAHIISNDPIYASGKETFIDEAITIAGGMNVFNFSGWRIVSVEDLIRANPEVIVVSSGSGMSGGRDVVYEWVISDKRLKNVEAVKNGKVFVIDADIISRPGPRIVKALEQVYEFINS